MGNFDHYNFKIPLTEYFDILQYCYNNDENKIDILTRTYDNKSIKIIRFNKNGDDEYYIDNLRKYFDFSIWQAHGGLSGDKNTVRKLINKYDSVSVILEYGGGFDKQSMLQHYYHPDAKAVILNHEKWKEFFPEEYQKRIYITPKQQSVDSKFFIPMDIEKKYDVLFVGRNENKGAETLYEIFKNESGIKILFKGNGYPDKWNSDNIIIQSAEYNHKILREIYNSAKIFVIGKPTIMENPYALHMRIITEALSCGLPIVAFKENFIESNLLYNNYNAFLIDTEIEFIEKIKLLLNDKELYKEMSYNARQVAIDCDISKFIKFYKELWNGL